MSEQTCRSGGNPGGNQTCRTGYDRSYRIRAWIPTVRTLNLLFRATDHTRIMANMSA
jgi:hypothetical protein